MKRSIALKLIRITERAKENPMTTIELKNKVLRKIYATNDVDILTEVYKILDESFEAIDSINSLKAQPN